MSDDADRENGPSEARTPGGSGDPGGSSWPRGEALAASVARLAGALEQEGEQLDLIAGSPDLDDVDTLAMAANQVAGQRRARGRPAGSRNRRNGDVFDYLQQLGHRDPLVTLSMIQTADTLALAQALASPVLDDTGAPRRRPDGTPIMVPADPLKVLAIQAKAAADLAQYGYAKQKELNVNVRKLHLMVAGDLGGHVVEGSGGLSIFGDEKANEINGASVRDKGDNSHG